MACSSKSSRAAVSPPKLICGKCAAYKLVAKKKNAHRIPEKDTYEMCVQLLLLSSFTTLRTQVSKSVSELKNIVVNVL